MIFRQLEHRFSILDDIPETLYAPLVTHSHGELLRRVKAILFWRQCMLQGRLPEEDELEWPEAYIKRTMLMRLETLKIVQYCMDQESLTDSILLDVLEGISSAEDYFALKAGGFVDKLAQRQKIKQDNSSFDDPDGLADHVQQNQPSADSQQENGGSSENETTGLDVSARMEALSATLSASSGHEDSRDQSRPDSHHIHAQPEALPQQQDADTASAGQKAQDASSSLSQQAQAAELFASENDASLAEEFHNQQDNSDQIILSSPVGGDENTAQQPCAEHSPRELTRITTDKLEQNWRELAEHWNELSGVYTELSGLLGQGWDLTQGVLAAQGWRDIIRYRKMVKELPELKQLIAMLGRWQSVLGDEDVQEVAEEMLQPIKTRQHIMDERWSRHAVMETGGIVLGDEISRLLPGELAQLGHPKLKMLWHARRAEGRLLNYCHCGMMPDIRQSKEDIASESQTKKPSSKISGPIIFCLDTSASMQGRPERIAKALVLEGVRLAFSEQRPCHIYSFSGEKQLIEHEVDLARGGLKQLLQFLQHSFSGGTDVVYPLEMALRKQQQRAWQDADILLLSDGRFPVLNDKLTLLCKQKHNQGLRIHGVLLGSWKSMALEQLCDPLHMLGGHKL